MITSSSSSSRRAKHNSGQITEHNKRISQLEGKVNTLSQLEGKVSALRSQMELWISATLQSVSLNLNINNNRMLKESMGNDC